MNCADARNLILSADHVALRDRSDPVLRAHLEGCADCAAAASHVVGDVARLRAALIARGSRAAARRPYSKTTRVAMTMVPLALAAELAAFAFLGNRDTPNPLVDRRPVIDDTMPAAVITARQVEIDTGEVSAAPKKSSTKAVRQVAAAKDSVEDPSDSTMQISGSEVMPSADMGQLHVTPVSRRQRVVVIGTPNPKVQVVLISKVDSL